MLQWGPALKAGRNIPEIDSARQMSAELQWGPALKAGRNGVL